MHSLEPSWEDDVLRHRRRARKIAGSDRTDLVVHVPLPDALARRHEFGQPTCREPYRQSDHALPSFESRTSDRSTRLPQIRAMVRLPSYATGVLDMLNVTFDQHTLDGLPEPPAADRAVPSKAATQRLQRHHTNEDEVHLHGAEWSPTAGQGSLQNNHPSGPAELAHARAVDAQRSAAAHAHPGRTDEATALEARRVYPSVNSHDLAAGVKALGDTGRCFPDSKSFTGTSRQAFDQLAKVMQPPPGWETHHLVEQARTPDFGTQAVHHTANAVNLPKAVHAEVTRSYNTGPLPGTSAYKYKMAHLEAKISTMRDYVKTLPYEAQRQFSIRTIRQVLHNPAVTVSEQDRTTVENELQKLENPTLCPPDLFSSALGDRR
jgi:hypothetical protein